MTPRDQARRDFAIRTIGCVVARLRGLGYLACERHHLTTGGKHGQKRLGEARSVGLNPWSHRGVAINGWTKAQCRDALGPSYAEQPAAFRRLYPDSVLEAEQQRLLDEYDRSTVQ